MPTPDTEWFEEARFGLFIHWGLYSIPAGIWDGKPYDDQLGEWIQYEASIPVADYERLTESFTAESFDAGEWVANAMNAGMRYMVVTAKHHDGFALFDSAVDDYNVVKRTPFGRDVIAELAAACQSAGLPFGVYYSHVIDWHEPHSQHHWTDPFPERFDEYFYRKSLPQVRELLTGYGRLALFWFDMPMGLPAARAEELHALVREHQPDCLVNGRLGGGIAGDFRGFGDNESPEWPIEGAGESPATMNDSWGFKSRDCHWKEAPAVARMLTSLAGKGVNLLMNVGPDSSGAWPKGSLNPLSEVGDWLKRTGHSIYSSRSAALPTQPDWGSVTQKELSLFVHVHDEAVDSIRLAEVLSEPSGARCLLSGETVNFSGTPHGFAIDLQTASSDLKTRMRTLEVRFPVGPHFDPTLRADGSGCIALPVARAHDSSEILNRSGRWKGVAPMEWATWEFVVRTPGKYRLLLHTMNAKHAERGGCWQGGHELELEVNNRRWTSSLECTESLTTTRGRYYAECYSDLGTVALDSAGEYRLRIRLENEPNGLTPFTKLESVRMLLRLHADNPSTIQS